MKHIHYLDEEAREVTEDGSHGTRIRVVIGQKDGAPNFDMRVLTFDPGSESCHHSHAHEHEVFVLSCEGESEVEVEGKKTSLKPGDVVFVPPNVDHVFRSANGMEIV